MGRLAYLRMSSRIRLGTEEELRAGEDEGQDEEERTDELRGVFAHELADPGSVAGIEWKELDRASAQHFPEGLLSFGEIGQ